MSCFYLPVGLCKDIEMIRKFWWGQHGDRWKIHWKKWDILCKSKLEGGMGFKDLCKFKEAMLAKQVWRLVHDTNSLFYKVFKVKYFPNGSVFDAKASSGSFAWRSILHARRNISQGAKWRLGDGSQIMIYGSNLAAWRLLRLNLISPLPCLQISHFISPHWSTITYLEWQSSWQHLPALWSPKNKSYPSTHHKSTWLFVLAKEQWWSLYG